MDTSKRKRENRTEAARRWYAEHTVTECPAWRPIPAGDPGPGPAIWSGQGTVAAPPAVGATVATRADLGAGVVCGYMVQDGPNGSTYLGVVLRLVAPPAWYTRQNGSDLPCLVYGAELDGTVAVRS